jgi:hypothetical protein
MTLSFQLFNRGHTNLASAAAYGKFLLRFAHLLIMQNDDVNFEFN